jgi:hypothetical protein
MKKIAYIISILVIAIGLSVGSCDFFDLDLTTDPNYLTPEEASLDGYLNSMQINFVYFLNDPEPISWNGMNKFGMEVSRMSYLFGATYSNAYTPTWFDGVWTRAYDILSDANTMIPLAEEQELYFHTGIAKTISAYVIATMVDYFGDIPFSESFDPANVNPDEDSQTVLYDHAMDLYDEALADFNQAEILPANDLFYYGDVTKWIKLVNTLKLKMYLNLRLLDAAGSKTSINALIAGDIITDPSEDFIFNYTTNDVDPDCRHPYFTYNYLGGANDYMSNYFMWTLYEEKGIIDPRMRYYFYRQTLELSDNTDELPCIASPKPGHYSPEMPFCALDEGYWGRDHLDPDGIPPDTKLRTVYGLYPAGGKFDDNSGTPVDQYSGAMGAGMEVIMLSTFVDFMRAEAALILGTNDNAKDMLLSGVQKSMDKVMGFKSSLVDPAFKPSAAMVQAYVDTVDAQYTRATTNDERLEIIAKEYYIALFGNGVETYNLVRRTLKPSNLQPALDDAPGLFYRTFTYPAVHVNLNSSATQKANNGIQVFWDTNPAGAIQ